MYEVCGSRQNVPTPLSRSRIRLCQAVIASPEILTEWSPPGGHSGEPSRRRQRLLPGMHLTSGGFARRRIIITRIKCLVGVVDEQRASATRRGGSVPAPLLLLHSVAVVCFPGECLTPGADFRGRLFPPVTCLANGRKTRSFPGPPRERRSAPGAFPRGLVRFNAHRF